jgi:hypothetical protein
VRLLRTYLLDSQRFTALGVGTVYAILRGAHLVIRECRSWFGRFGQSHPVHKEEFDRRKADVKAAYQAQPEGEITICLDTKRVYHRPERGAAWQHEEVPANRPARYPKSGTRSDVLGALAPREAQLTLAAVECADGVAVAQFLARVMQQLQKQGWRVVHLVMDNASVNTCALKQDILQEWLPKIRMHWTPTHASWLNLAEPMWSAFQRAVVQRSWFRDHGEVARATDEYEKYWQAHRREYHWPKQLRRRRAPAQPPWRQFLAIPINS